MEGTFDFNIINTGLKTMAMLFVVLGLLILVLYIIKRFLVNRKGTKGDALIKVISSRHLAAKERIEIVEVSGERIVLGITPGNINFLTKLNNKTAQNSRLNGKREGLETKKS